MFAVFFKNMFIDWWYNQASDKDWVDRTIAAMPGWNPNEVEVIWFNQRPSGTWSFDEQKRVVPHAQVSVDIPVLDEQGQPTGELESKLVWQPQTPITGKVYFKDGALV